jgi:hypothetical protein
MNAKIALFAALVVFGYLALNGLFMLCSPFRWAAAFWTAKGVYEDPQRRERLSSSRERRNVRLSGAVMFVGGTYALLAIYTAYH